MTDILQKMKEHREAFNVSFLINSNHDDHDNLLSFPKKAPLYRLFGILDIQRRLLISHATSLNILQDSMATLFKYQRNGPLGVKGFSRVRNIPFNAP